MTKINRKLFAAVHDQITAHPELHEQADWEGFTALPDLHEQADWEGATACGTKRCVGGWAVYLHGREQGWEDIGCYNDALKICGEYNMRAAAQKVLGLTDTEAWALFYGVSNAQAVEVVGLYAKGGRREVERKFGEAVEAGYVKILEDQRDGE